MEAFDKIECHSAELVGWGGADQIFTQSSVNVFLINIENHLNHLDDYYNLISDEEKHYSKKYKLIIDQQKYIISKAVRRIILSNYLCVDSVAVSFYYNEFKKPYINSKKDLYFSVSYSGTYIAMAFHNSEIGLDIEILNNQFDFDLIQNHVFNVDEQLAIKESKDKVNEFYTLWTRKESLIKATSQGIDEKFGVIPSLTGTHYIPKNMLHKNMNYTVKTYHVLKNIVLSIAIPSNGNHELYEINLYNWPYILIN